MVTSTKLRQANPWWEAKESIDDDGHIIEWEKSAIKYDPHLRHDIKYNFEPDNTVIYTLRGPRRVGKTTLIKLQIRDFLNKGRPPWSIFYYSFDTVGSKSGLVSVIEAYLKLSREYRKNARTYLFLDEVTGIADWQKGIKALVDGDRLGNCTVLATGSQAFSILRAAELLPGRRGRTSDPYDRLLIPMKFSEFVEIRNRDIWQFMRDNRLHSEDGRKQKALQLFSKNIPEVVDRLYVNFIDELNDCLDEYMLTGGTPKIVNEKVKTGFIPTELYAEYLNGIKGDWKPKDEDMLKNFADAVTENLGSATSWNNLRRQAELGSWATAQDYALVLKNMSIVSIIHKYGKKKKRALIRKQKKFYFVDPFYLHMFNAWHGMVDPFEASEEFLSDTNKGKMVEGIISNHLIRLAFSMVGNRQLFDYNNNVFFWNDDGKEVDFVLYVDGKPEIPIEVKYRQNIDPRKLGGIGSFQAETGTKSGLVLSKEELGAKQDYLVVPASVFLMLV